MKPYLYNAINALVLIVIGLWGYFSSENSSVTALIPVFAGILLIALTKLVKDGNKVVAHLVVILTFLVLIALIKPLLGSLERENNTATIRVVIMMLTNAIALFAYIKSFIDVRKNRKTI